MENEDNKQLNLPQREEKILEFWDTIKPLDAVLKKRAKGKRFVFYEGPPTANGMPGIHHIEARAFKDVILRYKTMQGFFVPRRAGWDTHGLPVEIGIEKELGFKTKHDIERYGIAPFNKKAKESVWKYKDEWERFTRRMGFWLDLEHPYVTYETSYIESLWAIIKTVYEKKLLYKDFKVMPWCPRCETGLSSHEVGQGYKKVKDNSVFVKFPLRDRENEFLLVWTTTPWTLPANVAIAVNPKLEYTKYKVTQGEETEYIWSAKTPPIREGDEVSVVEKVSGNVLKNLSYEPLFTIPNEYAFSAHPKPPYVTIAADFVSAEEGSGIVHLAPAFGEEDMTALKRMARESDGLYPILHTVNTDGTMKKGIIGEGKFVKDADRDIIENLKKRHLLFSVLPFEHEYPHCWRCSTPLLYFARQSWWIRMSQLREKLLKNNEKVNWIPDHIKHGRFGEFLREIRDWAFSRERFWGTPLPVWECNECSERVVIGSIKELERHCSPPKNQYLLVRHGESLSNIKNIAASGGHNFPLTSQGKKQVLRTARALKSRNIDLIITSPVERAEETAKIIADTLGIKVTTDKRLKEIDVGAFDGRSVYEYNQYFESTRQRFERPAPEGESLDDVRARTADLLRDTEKKYKGKKILFVSHEDTLWMLSAVFLGLSVDETEHLRTGKKKNHFIDFAEIKETPYRNLPRDEKGGVNLHRPFVDEISFPCTSCKQGTMRRVKEVVDGWFDSGAMPFAQDHWMSSKDNIFYPADYISEAVDQTRGWFYTLLAVGTLLGKEAPYKNVISLGHVLDKNGQKMSKSKGNVVDPLLMMQKYGADAVRWFFYTVNPPGEPKRFDEKDISNKLRSFHGTLWNSYLFFDTYVDRIQPTPLKNKNSKHILDQWVCARLNQLIEMVRRSMDQYDIISSARAIEEFVVGDFSQWYLRRSRRRFQRPESKKEKDDASSTLGAVLLALSELIAPFTPFFAESLYHELRKKDKNKLKDASVHFRDFPMNEKRTAEDIELLYDMEVVRSVVREAQKLRAQAGIKIRQPMQELFIKETSLETKSELIRLIKEEVNVKKVTIADEMKLDTVITPELREEGIIREVVRNVQEMRKSLSLSPKDPITVQFSGPRELDEMLEKWKKTFEKETGAERIKIGGKKEMRAERELDIDGATLWVGVL